MFWLSTLLGETVRDPSGDEAGRLVDVLARPAASGPGAGSSPPVTGLVVRSGRQHQVVTWSDVTRFEPGGIELTRARRGDRSECAHDLRLARDVLDTQVIDVAGVRVGRVSEVLLAAAPSDSSGPHVTVAGVDLGARGLMRRLGFTGWSKRAREQLVPWADVHLTSAHAPQLQLGAPPAALRRLHPSQVATLVEDLPTRDAAAVLDSLPHQEAADALRRTSPHLANRLLHALSRHSPSDLVGAMPVDDAVALLRHCSADRLDALLGAVGTQHAAVLRRLLAHRPGTAGGLMTSAVRTAGVGEPVEEIRRSIADVPPAPPEPAVVFVVDDDGHPVGSWEPIDLLTGRSEPRAVHTVEATAPAERAVDLLALHDISALAVVDSDGVLVGAISDDDALEELLVERLPGRGRYRALRRRTPHRDRG